MFMLRNIDIFHWCLTIRSQLIFFEKMAALECMWHTFQCLSFGQSTRSNITFRRLLLLFRTRRIIKQCSSWNKAYLNILKLSSFWNVSTKNTLTWFFPEMALLLFQQKHRRYFFRQSIFHSSTTYGPKSPQHTYLYFITTS